MMNDEVLKHPIPVHLAFPTSSFIIPTSSFSLELAGGDFYCRRMKRISFLLVTLALCGAPAVRGQNAATEEHLNKLSGQIETILETQQALSKRIESLAKEMENLREQASKPAGNYASQERLDALVKAVAEVDRKRVQDAEKIKSELDKIAKNLLKEPAAPHGKPKPTTSTADAPVADQEHFEYVIKSGDYLSTIVQAYRDQKIKVSVEQILKANPGLKADRLVVGKTIIIPAPKP
jgi:cell division protein FtsB